MLTKVYVKGLVLAITSDLKSVRCQILEPRARPKSLLLHQIKLYNFTPEIHHPSKQTEKEVYNLHFWLCANND